MSIVLVILLAIVVLSFVPLAGRRGGWAQYAMNNITTDLMVQLGLAPWDHYVDVGYIQVSPQQTSPAFLPGRHICLTAKA